MSDHILDYINYDMIEKREDFPILAKPYRNAQLARMVREVLLRKLRMD